MNERTNEGRNLGKWARIGIAAGLAVAGLAVAPTVEATSKCATEWKDVHLNPGDNQTLPHLKRAILTVDADIPGREIFHDSDPLTGELIIVNFPKPTDLTGLNISKEAVGGNERIITSCVSEDRFFSIITKMEHDMHKGQPQEFITTQQWIPAQ